jgi:hypothetical protein
MGRLTFLDTDVLTSVYESFARIRGQLWLIGHPELKNINQGGKQ